MSGRGRGGSGGRGRGRGGGSGRGAGGRGGQPNGGGGEGNGTDAGASEYADEFDVVQSTRQIKGDEEDDYVGGAAAGRDLEGDDDEDDDQNVRRMTKQFAWEEERMEEEYNEAGDKMEPFNLKTERTEGFFDESGNFVWKKEEGGADPWLASLENEEDLEARIGEAALARKKKEEEEAEVDETPEQVDKEALKESMLRLLQPGETVLHALKRLGPQKKKAPQGGGGGKATVQKAADERTPEEKKKFDELTELADQLLRAGVVDVYDKSYEAMQADLAEDRELMSRRQGGANRKRPAAGITGEAAGVGAGGARWEYKGPDGQVHGPYGTAEILQWRAQGFFTGPTAVEIRRVGGGGEGGGRGRRRGRANQEEGDVQCRGFGRGL